MARERARRAAEGLEARCTALKAFQQQRFRLAYADLLATPRYAGAARFFLEELYGPRDYRRRDQQFQRIVKPLVRLFPAEVVDTVAQLAAYQRLYGGPANWYALTGSAADLNRLWSFLGVYRKRVAPDPGARNWRTHARLTYDVEHSDEVFFFGRNGRERFILEGMPQATRAGIPTEIYRFLSKEGRDNLRPGKGDWTQAQAVRVIDWLRSVR